MKIASSTKILLLLLVFQVSNTTATDTRDAYGGWREVTFEATGFFQLKKKEDRWWLVTPEGNAFLIHGMDHVGIQLTNKPYNREHWNQTWGLGEDSRPADRANAFYEQKLVHDRSYLGFNTLYSNQVPVGRNVAPYMPRARTINNEYWRTHSFRQQVPPWSEENFLDVFADTFVAACEETSRRLVRENRVEDPWLLAYLLTDSPILVPYEARPFPAGFYHKPLPGTTTWPVRLRNLGKDAPGKLAYVALMKTRYADNIGSFNAAYNTVFESWEALTKAENWRTVLDTSGHIHEERDNHAFLLKILDKAWGTQVKTIRKYDPNHLILGDTLNLNSPLPDDIITLYAKHFPILVYQYYGTTWEDHLRLMDRLRRIVPDMPIFCADSSWSVCQPPHMPDTLGPQCADYTVAAERFKEAYQKAFARPDFIGWGWCGWMDQWASAEPVKQHGGLQDAFGNWHQPLADEMSEFGKILYSVARP